MFKMLGFLRFGRQTRTWPARPNSAAAYAEALLAGWVPPLAAPSRIQAQDSTSPSATGRNHDMGAFLARVYRNQQC